MLSHLLVGKNMRVEKQKRENGTKTVIIISSWVGRHQRRHNCTF